MDKQIQKLQSYLKKYLGKPESDIYGSMEKPLNSYDNTIFYPVTRNLIRKDEIAFIIEDGKVADIVITEYVFGIAMKNIFYHPKDPSPFMVVNLLNKKRTLFPKH